MLKKIVAGVLVCVLLTACGAGTTAPVDDPVDASPRPVVAYVPLDDRPDNVERVVYLAESVGYALEMPDADLYRTRLDGQPLNGNGTQFGDPYALYEWVLEQEAAGCDRYILSLDQMLYGGLVNSRETAVNVAVHPDIGTILLSDLLEDLMTALSADPNNTVWLLDSVMRLAPTRGYNGGTLDNYNLIRAFGSAPRQVLEGSELTLENIFQGYGRAPNGESTIYDDIHRENDVADNYDAVLRSMEARERKLRLSDEVQHILAQPGYEHFRLLIGIDDSSLENCIQTNEIAYLRRGLRTDAEGKLFDWLLSGVDDLAFKAVARMYLDEVNGFWNNTAAVRYFGGSENAPACDYDFQPLTEIVEEHFSFFGLEAADPEHAALQVLILTQPQDESAKQTYCKALVNALQECRKNHRPTVVIDAGNGRYGTMFHELLTKEAELGWLVSYAGFLDMAIVTGTALSHGAVRLAVLERGGGDEAMERAFAKTLADSVIKDFCYKNIVREDLLAYIRNELSGDPNNFWVPEIDRTDLVKRLEAGMEAATADVVRNFERSNLLVSLAATAQSAQAPYEERGWGGVELGGYRFPWDRAFEIGMDIRLGEFTEVHKELLGIYYQ